jgi:hypothetical protein
VARAILLHPAGRIALVTCVVRPVAALGVPLEGVVRRADRMPWALADMLLREAGRVIARREANRLAGELVAY